MVFKEVACKAFTAASLSLAAVGAYAAPSLNLANYQLSGQFALPTATASEASAITFNWDSGTLFVVGDEGDAITEVTLQGTVVGSMKLSGFDDTEGLTYVGNGQFAVVEERLQDVFLLTYAAGSTASRGSLSSVSLGTTVGNIGLEGASYDPRSGSFVLVKEKTPSAVYGATLAFGSGPVTPTSLFNPASLGVADLADVQVLGSVFAAQPYGDNLLLLSQESSRLMEVTRDGTLLSSYDLSGISSTIEGVTIDSLGRIYLTDETPNVYVLTAVPEPQTYALMLGGLACLAWAARRRA